MKRVVVCDEPQEVCSSSACESKFYTLKTKSGTPFMLVRANSTREDMWHWVALGKTKNRKTGYASFTDAINAQTKSGHDIREFDSMADAFEYLAELAG